jgi:hypothetical protein
MILAGWRGYENSMRFNYLKSGSSFVQNSMQAQVGTPDRKLGGGVLYGGKIEPPSKT